MGAPLPSTPPGVPPSGHSGVLLYIFATALVGLFGWLGALSMRIAPLQASLNDAFKAQLEAWQDERAQLIVRVSGLEGENLALRGQVRGLEQQRDSLIALAIRADNNHTGWK